ncbi:ATP-binding protein [Halodurantibacterium flavum]
MRLGRSALHPLWLLPLVAFLVAVAVLTLDPRLSIACLLLAAGLLLAMGGVHLAALARRMRERRLRRQVAAVVACDAIPAFTTDAMGRLHYQNAAAVARFGGGEGGPGRETTLLQRLEGHFASPSSTIYRLQRQAAAEGAAREELSTRAGTARLSVHRITGGFLWRFDETAGDLAARTAEPVSLPRLIVNARGKVLSMNRAMRNLLGREATQLDELLPPGVVAGDVAMIETARGQVPHVFAACEIAAGRQEVFFLPAPEPIAERATRNGTTCLPAPLSFEEFPVGLLRLTDHGIVLGANRLARELLHHTPSQGARLGDLVDGLGRSVSDWIGDCAAGRTVARPEVVRAVHATPVSYLQVTLRLMPCPSGNELFALLHDATELKTLEAQFVQSQKMHAIGQLAGGVAHDFNNLLTAISGHCDLLLLRHDKGDPDYPDLVQIHQNANRAASLVGQLLAFSRKQTLQLQLIDLRDSLTDLGHLLNRLVGERVRLVVAQPAELDLIRADPRQLEQVLMNLVVNARDAMPAGGEIRIEARNEDLLAPISRDRTMVPAGRYVVIRIKDEGQGIPPEVIGKIFEPFFTTKRAGEGTGLGLSTAYGIVKQTGGFIFADSTPGVGTTFSLYLPAHEGTLPQRAPEPSPPALGPGTGIVLLVEDEAPVRAFAARALRLRGYTTLEAESGEEALALLDNPDLSVDLILSDVIMPGLDGPGWVRQAREVRPDVKVIFMSGYAEDGFSEAQARIPNSVFLQKPFSLNKLTETVQSLLS